MKSIIIKFIFISLVTGVNLKAQFLEFGLGLGPTNARTDIGGFNALNTRIGGSGFFRYNFNEIWVFRADIMFARIAGYDKYYNDRLQNLRKMYFFTNTLSLGAHIEYNFLNFRSLKNDFRWSPFLSLGVSNYALFGGSEGAGQGIANIGIPFGLGVKYKLSEHWNLGAMFITTKTFNDKIDGIFKGMETQRSPKVLGIEPSTNDWFHYFGFTISYTIYSLKCPDYFQDMTPPGYWQKSDK